MNCYNLFGEWRNRTIYGETLADAVLREKHFQRPDRFAEGEVIAEGEHVTVEKIVGEVDTSNTKRGGKPIHRVVAALADGRVVDFDATEERLAFIEPK